ncbi:putative polyketide synthase [Aspergillus egyptiacus]|nr:putative polyketide synthase [Aspergillus egyptiacus]
MSTHPIPHLDLLPTTFHAHVDHDIQLALFTAWSIVASKWFYQQKVEFTAGVQQHTTAVSISTPPEATVGQVVEQLRRDVILPPTNEFNGDVFVEHAIEAVGGQRKVVLRVDYFQTDTRHDVQIQIRFAADQVRADEAERLGRMLETVAQQLSHDGSRMQQPISEINVLCEHDLAQLWQWNEKVPPAVEKGVHVQIQENAREHPDALAIHAWDGDLSYGQLDRLSTRVAHRLVRLGVKRDVVVPLYFEKSVWMPVAMLGVLKAGGVLLQLASSIPKGRTEAIVNAARPLLGVVCPDAPVFLHDLMPTYPIPKLLEEEEEERTEDEFPLPPYAADQDVARLFTSGSTGHPKGIVLTHRTLSTGCAGMADAFGFNPSSRLFQSAPYEFDVSMLETFSVLTAGGCLCIPTEQEGIHSSPAAIRRLQANVACITPTLAAKLDPDSVPSLHSLVTEGEILPRQTAARWSSRVATYTWYGSSECSLVASARIDPVSYRTGFIGSSPVCLRWVVDPQNHNLLLPVGAVGELVVEGPVLPARYVGAGPYQAQFFTPDWLRHGSSRHAGREGRLFKTGDLVRFEPDGTMVILGRKDTQVQIHAERVELSEVEHNVRRFLRDDGTARADAVVAEMISPIGSSEPTLAVFMTIQETTGSASQDRKLVLQQLCAGLDEQLADNVPRTMIPFSYVALERIPMTATGKTDRRQLRQMAASWTAAQLADQHVSRL